MKFTIGLGRRTAVQQSSAARAGLTVLEFVGCLIAVIGGAWLGALYLGVDVNNVAYTALAQSDLLDKVPAEWRPEGPADKAMTREQLVTHATRGTGVAADRDHSAANRPGPRGNERSGGSGYERGVLRYRRKKKRLRTGRG